MKKSKLIPTIEETFQVGHLEGTKDSLSEIKFLIENGANTKHIKLYVETRLKSLNTVSLGGLGNGKRNY